MFASGICESQEVAWDYDIKIHINQGCFFHFSYDVTTQVWCHHWNRHQVMMSLFKWMAAELKSTDSGLCVCMYMFERVLFLYSVRHSVVLHTLVSQTCLSWCWNWATELHSSLPADLSCRISARFVIEERTISLLAVAVYKLRTKKDKARCTLIL